MTKNEKNLRRIFNDLSERDRAKVASAYKEAAEGLRHLAFVLSDTTIDENDLPAVIDEHNRIENVLASFVGANGYFSLFGNVR